jgi:hypothetical protein
VLASELVLAASSFPYLPAELLLVVSAELLLEPPLLPQPATTKANMTAASAKAEYDLLIWTSISCRLSCSPVTSWEAGNDTVRTTGEGAKTFTEVQAGLSSADG